MKNAYKNSLQKSAAQRIFETIPDHVFWDIKKPFIEEQQKILNPYNPFRKYPFDSFFDLRNYEEYMDRRNYKQNINDSVSLSRRY